MTSAVTLVDEPVLAITVRPPWSHWIALGVKPPENRSWRPPRGWDGALVIHAGKTLDPFGFAYGARLGHAVGEDEVARGEFIAVCRIREVHWAGPDCGAECQDWGQPGCFHWMLSGVRRLTSMEGRGRQKLFVPPADVVSHALEVVADDRAA
ncbi:hypothetical protein [Amycolatopsis sp. NPDC058986]|uniref:hypothetical protein n=1 Tax=unclassified Amycolatopsis TaxID=2618356 RepID=UPI0036703175